jgi:hypothetical protein
MMKSTKKKKRERERKRTERRMEHPTMMTTVSNPHQ